MKRTAASDSAEPFGPELKAEGLVAGRQSHQKRPDAHPTGLSVMLDAKSNVMLVMSLSGVQSTLGMLSQVLHIQH